MIAKHRSEHRHKSLEGIQTYSANIASTGQQMKLPDLFEQEWKIRQSLLKDLNLFLNEINADIVLNYH